MYILRKLFQEAEENESNVEVIIRRSKKNYFIRIFPYFYDYLCRFDSVKIEYRKHFYFWFSFLNIIDQKRKKKNSVLQQIQRYF